MARARIRRERFASGELPEVCALTGASPDTRIPARAVRIPAWNWLLLLVGVVPFIVSLFFSVRVVESTVPVAQQAHDELATLRQVAQLLAVAGTMLVFVWLTVPWAPIGLLGVGVLIGALVVWLARRDRAPVVRLRDEWVVFDRVHPRFAAALREQLPPAEFPWSSTGPPSARPSEDPRGPNGPVPPDGPTPREGPRPPEGNGRNGRDDDRYGEGR